MGFDMSYVRVLSVLNEHIGSVSLGPTSNVNQSDKKVHVDNLAQLYMEPSKRWYLYGFAVKRRLAPLRLYEGIGTVLLF